MQILQLLSILLEVGVAKTGVDIAVKKNRKSGWGIALTFAIYVLYDLSKLVPLRFPDAVLYPGFFIATVSIFWATRQMLKESA